MYIEVVHRPDELSELRHAAELLEAFIASASPHVVSQPVIDAAKAELTIIYGEIEPYDNPDIPF